MLKKPAEKFHGIKFHGTPTVTSGFFVPDKHIPSLNFDNAMVGDGHLKNVGREVFDTCFAITDGLAIYIPVNFPDLGGYPG